MGLRVILREARGPLFEPRPFVHGLRKSRRAHKNEAQGTRAVEHDFEKRARTATQSSLDYNTGRYKT